MAFDPEAHAPIHGDPVLVVELAGDGLPQEAPPGAMLIGVDRAGRLPEGHEQSCDILLTTIEGPPRPWIGTRPHRRLDEILATLRENARRRPLATSVLAQVLRVGEPL